MSFKRAKVVMIPVNDENKKIGNIVLSHIQGHKPNTLGTYCEDKIHAENMNLIKWIPQHLYILSDDKIKENTNTFKEGLNGDWFYNTKYKTIANNGDITPFDFKIIATTDSSLKITPYEWRAEDKDKIRTRLPEPSQSFIQKYVEEYNRGNVINDVLVEYEEVVVPDMIVEGAEKFIDTLKVNPKDNTITITKLKDSWSREEICQIIGNFSWECTQGVTQEQVKKWIEENL